MRPSTVFLAVATAGDIILDYTTNALSLLSHHTLSVICLLQSSRATATMFFSTRPFILHRKRCPRRLCMDKGHLRLSRAFFLPNLPLKTPETVCASPVDMDIIFLLDVSASLSNDGFHQEKQHLTTLIESEIPQSSRIGIIYFCNDTSIIASLNHSLTKPQLIKTLSLSTRIMSGFTRTGECAPTNKTRGTFL